MIKILPVSENDAVHILHLIQEYFPYFHMDLEKLVRRIHSSQYWCYKSVEKEQITGYAEWEIVNEKNKIIRLNGIAVFPRFHGKGFASALLKRGEEDARSRGMKKLTLIVGENNQPARELYRKMGFEFVRPNLEKIDGQKAEVWEKNLN